MLMAVDFLFDTKNMTMNVTKCKNLFTIPITEWEKLRDIYKRKWPKNSYSYYALDNYIKFANNDRDCCERTVHIWSIDEKWREHGLYFLEDHFSHCYTLRVDICSRQHLVLLQTAMHNVDLLAYTEIIFRDKTALTVKQHLEKFGYKININLCSLARFYYLPKDKSLKLEIRPRSDFIIKPLTLADINDVNDNWAYKSEGSTFLIGRIIQNYLSMGAYHPVSGELCAWVLHCELGTMGLLYVKAEYRRLGLAESLVRQMCRTLAEQDCDATAHIEDTNTPSVKLFKKLEFEPVECNYWFLKDNFMRDTKGDGQFYAPSGETMHHG